MKSWPEVTQSEAYQTLPPQEQESARVQYFDQVVAPHVPQGELKRVRLQFDQDTANDSQSNAILDMFSSANAGELPPVTPLARDSIPADAKPFTEIMRTPTPEELANRATLGESADAITQMLGDVPEHSVAAFQNLLAGKDVDVFNPSPAQVESEKLLQERLQQPGGEKQVIPGLTVKDFRQTAPSIPFSALSAGAGLAAGAASLPATALPVPGARAIPWLAGSAASGTAAYRQDVAMFMQDAFNAYNQESLEKTGKPLTPEQWATRKQDIDSIATKHGLWEAIPEAAGNVAALKIVISPLKKYLGKSILTRLPAKYAGIMGTELATETVTQQGQQTAEAEAEIPGAEKRSFTSAEDLLKSAGEVAPQTAILTTLMGGAAGGGKVVADIVRKGAKGAPAAADQAQPDAVQDAAEALQKGLPSEKAETQLHETTTANVLAGEKFETSLKPMQSQEQGGGATSISDDQLKQDVKDILGLNPVEPVIKPAVDVDPATVNNDVEPGVDTERAVEGSQETPNQVAEPVSAVKQPWQMTRKEWVAAREAATPEIVQSNFTRNSGSQAVSNIAETERLIYGVPDEASQKMKAHLDGDIKLTKEEYENVRARLDTKVQHFDVIQKAVNEGQSVPREVLEEYPNLIKKPDTAMFSKEDGSPTHSTRSILPGGKPKGITQEQANAAIEKFAQEYKGAGQLSFLYAPSKAAAFGPGQFKDERVKGAYYGKSGRVLLIGSDLASAKDALETIRHEVIGHHGLNTFEPTDRQAILDRVKASRKARTTQNLWRTIDRNYKEANEDTKAEEFLAHLAQHQPPALSKLWNDLLVLIRTGLRRVGLIGDNYGKSELNKLVEELVARIKRGESQKTVPESDEAQFSDIRFSKERDPGKTSDAIKRIDAHAGGKFDNLKRWSKRNFTKEGLMNGTAFEAKIAKDSMMNVGEADISYMARDLNKAVAKAFGESYNRVSDKDLEKVNAYLAGEDVGLPADLIKTLAHLREHLDRLSGGMLNAIKDMLRIEYGKLSASEKETFDGFLNGTEDTVPVSMQKHMALYQTISGNRGVYLTRSYQAFDDAKWKTKALKNTDLINRAEGFIRENNEDLTDAEVSGAVSAILQAAKKSGNFVNLVSKGTKVGSKDVSMLNRRKQVPAVIRELLGEHKDPKVNYVRSATKMQWYVANHNFLMDLRSKGLGSFLHEKPTVIDGVSYDDQIAVEGSEAMNPLDGLYTTGDFRQGLEDALDKFDGSDLMRQIIRINSMVKYGKTILAPTTQARNFMSASMFAIMNGHFNWLHAAKSFKAARADLFTKNVEWRKYIDHLTGLGVLHDNPYAGELRDALRDMVEMDVYTQAPGQGAKQFLSFMQRLYQVGDDFWKIIGFENELSAQLKAGLSKTQAEKKAAYRIRNGYPTYSMVPRGVKKIRRWPLIGTFVSFPYEIVRTTYNQFGFIREDMKDNKAEAARRAVGFALASSAAYAASVTSMIMMGLDGDDDEAVRAQLPEWSRNAQLLYMGYDKNGMPVYLDLSYLDPYTYIKTPLTAVMNGNNEGIDEKIGDALNQFLEPFIGADIAASAIGEVAFNKRIGGGQVYNEEDTGLGKAKSILQHLRKALQPGVVSNLERTMKAIDGDASRSGKQYSLKDEGLAWIGFRLSTLNIPQSLIYSAYDFKDSKAQATRLLSYTAGSGSKVPDKELNTAVRTMIASREKAYQEMSKLVTGAEKLGMTRSQIRTALKAARVSEDDIRHLYKGVIPKWSMTTAFLKSAADRAKVSAVNDERRRELVGEMRKRRQYINQSVKQEYEVGAQQ